MMLFKLKFMHKAATLDIVNNGQDTVILKPEEILGILDLRYLGYCKIKQDILQKNKSKYYKFKRADTLCKHFNKFINTMEKERTKRTERKLPMVRSK